MIWVLLLLLLTACSTIDDDLSNCPAVPTPPAGTTFTVGYDLTLVTNLTTELSTELTTVTDVNVASALRSHLSSVFTDYAHDVNLSFYDTEGDSVLLQQDRHEMEANQASYSLNLPMRHYMHIAVANIDIDPTVSLASDRYCHTSSLQQAAADTVPSHVTGIFTARMPMEVLEGVDQQFNVHLYMANCAAALVVDTLGSGIRELKVFTTGFATGMNIADSVYVYPTRSPIVRTTLVDSEAPGTMTFSSVSFPSRDFRPSRTVIETTDPFEAATAAESLWEFRVYAKLADGSTTESVLHIATPLRAGQMRVVKARTSDDGAVRSTDPQVSVSITTQWSEGGHYESEL